MGTTSQPSFFGRLWQRLPGWKGINLFLVLLILSATFLLYVSSLRTRDTNWTLFGSFSLSILPWKPANQIHLFRRPVTAETTGTDLLQSLQNTQASNSTPTRTSQVETPDTQSTQFISAKSSLSGTLSLRLGSTRSKAASTSNATTGASSLPVTTRTLSPTITKALTSSTTRTTSSTTSTSSTTTSIPTSTTTTLLTTSGALTTTTTRSDLTTTTQMLTTTSTASKNFTDASNTSNAVACKFPVLLVDDPLIKPYLRNVEPLQCAKMKNWVYTENNTFFITDEAAEKYGKINCTYYHIYRNGDEDYKEETHLDFKNGSELLGDYFRVSCVGDKKDTYNNVHLCVHKDPKLLERKRAENATTGLGIDIYMYLIDSMSRVNFIRKLPQFYKLITEELDGVVMSGFNIVGDGTPWSLIPITTGHFQTEMYEGRKRFDNASYLDDWPVIFKDFKRSGYITSFAEEQAPFNFFNYKLKGFKDPPVDHYLRPFEQAIRSVRGSHKEYCLGDTPRALMLCQWWQQHQDLYRPLGIHTFSLLFSSETSHDDYNQVQSMDGYWTDIFRKQHSEGYFNNTLLIIMGDHGRRFGPVRQTQSGKTEEKMPFLAVITDQQFRDQHPESWENIKKNADRLVTPFDIHATLADVIDWKGDGRVGNLTNRGISLFEEIPKERTCADAWIKPHFCSCLEWEELDVKDATVTKAVTYVLDEFNKALKAAKDLCAPLTLDHVISAQKLHPSAALMAFKESSDFDNISPNLSADKTLQSVLYKIRFVTMPNNADYEVSIDYFLKEDTFTFSFDLVTRLNMYGEQPHCTINTHQQLRKYCICNDLVKKKP